MTHYAPRITSPARAARPRTRLIHSLVATPSVTGPSANGAYAANERIEARVAFDLGLEGTRREAANDDRAPEHGLRLRGALRW